jgi:hypothetical protein
VRIDPGGAKSLLRELVTKAGAQHNPQGVDNPQDIVD